MNIFSLKNLKKIIFLIFLIFLFSFSPQTLNTKVATYPFAGRIIGYIPTCNGGIATLIFLQIPLGAFPPTVMYVPGGSYSFLMGPPTHPGQWLLGNTLKSYVPCVVGACPACTVVGGGPVILFHGSSL